MKLKMILILLAMVSLLVLSGCYRPNWYRANTTRAELETDSESCKGQTKIGATREEMIEQYEKCMKDKGYQSSGSPSIAKEKFDLPTWNVGDSWIYTYPNKRKWKFIVEKVEDGLYIVNVGLADKYCFNKKTLELKHFLNPQGRKTYPLDDNILLGIYIEPPIYVGRKWGKAVSGRSMGGGSLDYLHEFKVISFEDITVSAGKLKAFKIEFKRSVLRNPYDFLKRYIWISPEAKNIIKFSLAEISGTWKTGISDYELVSYKLVEKHDKKE